MTKVDPIDLSKLELKRIREMRSISFSLDSPDVGTMYTAAAKLMSYPEAKSLLPKAMSLLETPDATLRRLVFRMAARNIYGEYIPELFSSIKHINPAEREQVLQGIEELFQTTGSPTSLSEQKRWIDALTTVGHEHQSTVFGIMASLGRSGIKWVKKRVKDNIETISIGTIPKFRAFESNVCNDLIKILSTSASKKKRELLPYLCDIAESASVKFLKPFLEEGKWQDRVHVARAIGKIGVTSTSGLVMDIVADPDWRVKQEFLEAINIEDSRFSSLVKILSYFVGDSHSRVRGQADKVILTMGVTTCGGSNLEAQRKKLEKQFRVQLLRAASTNRDIDSRWLDVEIEDHPIPFIPDEGDEEGLSLADLQPEPEKKEEPVSPKLDLMAALLKAQDDSTPQPPLIPISMEEDNEEDDIGSGLPPTERFMHILKKLSKGKKKGVSLTRIKEHASSLEMSNEEVEEALVQLEKDGIVYRLKSGAIKRVDMDTAV